MAHAYIVLSAVSAEFRRYCKATRHGLMRQNVLMAVQESFIATGTETLDMLGDYIWQCYIAQAPSLGMIRSRYPDLGERLSPLAPFLQSGALPHPVGGVAGGIPPCKPICSVSPECSLR